MRILALGLLMAAACSAQRVAPRIGRWIWDDGEAKPVHYYLFLRRSFALDARPTSARLRITASDRYLVFVNGVYLGRGPARSSPALKSFDTFDIAERLRSGSNTIAVRAYTYGHAPVMIPVRPRPGNNFAYGERAGFWAELEVQTPQRTLTIGSDDEWRVSPAKGWMRFPDADSTARSLLAAVRAARLVNPLQGNNEIYDANADPVDWMSPEFNDSSWAKARLITQPSLTAEKVQPWALLEPRGLPQMRETEVLPAKVVKVGEVLDMSRRDQSEIPEFLDSEIHLPFEHTTVRNPDAVLANDGRSAEFQGRLVEAVGIRAPYIIVDFGRQVFGFPRVRLSAVKGAVVDMTYNQQFQGGRIKATEGYFFRNGDRYVARQGEQTWELAEYKQFRYLLLTIRSLSAPVRIESISVNEYGYPAEQRGRFECSDPMLTRLWQAAVDTTYLMMEDCLVCDAFRERILHAPTYTINHVHGMYAGFGALPLADRQLKLIAQTDDGTGVLNMKFPPDYPPERNFSNALLLWSTAVREHHLFSANRDLLERLYPTVQKQIDWFEPFRDEIGLLRNLPYRLWVDYAPLDIRGASFIVNAQYVMGLEDAAWLADRMGRTSDAGRWRKIAEDVRSTLRRVFWNDQKGIYEDSYNRGRLTGAASDLANGFALLCDIATGSQASRIVANISSPSPQRVEATPLTIGYILDGLLKQGFAGMAIDTMRTRFARMLESGDRPTLWEEWGPYSLGNNQAIGRDEETSSAYQPISRMGRSLAHCSPVLVAYVISTRILGVMPTGPGFTTCSIRPRLGALQWVKGKMPAPQGEIEVEARRESGKMLVTTRVPSGIQAEVILDRDAAKKHILIHNGRRYELGPSAKSPAPWIVLDGKELRLAVNAGSHTIELHEQ